MVLQRLGKEIVNGLNYLLESWIESEFWIPFGNVEKRLCRTVSSYVGR